MRKDMKIYYIENVRLPTEKAHGYQIMKTCEAMVEQGADLTLICAARRNLLGDKDSFAYYDIRTSYPLIRLAVTDFLGKVPSWLWQPAFLLERFTFARSLRRFAKTMQAGSVCYTRDARIAAALKRLRPDLRISVELHALPNPAVLKAWLP